MSRGAAYPIPAWRVDLDGQDLTARIQPRLLQLRLTECRGEEADQLDIEVHDHDGLMAMPRRGVKIRVAIGWADAGLIEKGTFIVDEVEHRGSPDTITVRARSADLTQAMRSRRERSWHETTLGRVIGSLAGENSLEARVASSLAGIEIPHLDQAGESDAQLLTRLGRRFDAVATVKEGALLFLPIGAGVSASGLALPGLTITRREGDGHAWSTVDREKYSGVRAYWHDRQSARRKSVVAGVTGNAKRLKRTFASEAQARQEAQAEWRRIQRGAERLRYSLALGRPELSPEQRVSVSGLKQEIDSVEWLVTEVTHTITGAVGYRSDVVLESVLEGS